LETIRVRDGLGRALLALNFLVATVPDALAYDRAGQASIIDGDTLEIHGARIRLWGIDAPISFVEMKTANTITVGRKQRTILMLSLHAARSNASKLIAINTSAPLRSAVQVSISHSGS
jgi:hypothetical protein